MRHAPSGKRPAKHAHHGKKSKKSIPDVRVAELPVQSHARPRAERVAEGKSKREQCPRGAQAAWVAPANRADPVGLLEANSRGRLSELLPIRYGRMLASPFAFYRGAAAIMAYDLSHTLASGMNVVACGDSHLMNFGGFATPERRLVFDINDFDEASVAPWEWDVKRLAASFVIAGQSRGFDAADCKQAAWTAANSYRQHMARYAEMPILEAYYEYIDLEDLIATGTDPEMKKLNRKRLRKATEESAHTAEFAKLAYVSGETPRIKDEPPLVFHHGALETFRSDPAAVEQVMAMYAQSLPVERRLLLDRYRMVDAAIKVVGVGSVGTRCGIILMMSGGGDPLFLQFKEARPSVLEAYCGRAPFEHDGQRVVVFQKLMQAASDMFLGWTSGPFQGHHYYLRQLRDAKIKPMVELMGPQNLTGYATACGWALARAHKRSADAAMLGGYMGTSEAFEDALAEFAMAYAQRNEQDHAALVAAVRAGRVEATLE